jgi:hypothetical protein
LDSSRPRPEIGVLATATQRWNMEAQPSQTKHQARQDLLDNTL